MEKIKAVIFDWGGVLIDDPAPGLMQYCANAFGVPKQDYTEAHKQFQDQFQKGLLTEDQFWTTISTQLGREKPKINSLWTEAFEAVYRPKDQMLALARNLQKNSYKTALLSDTEPPGMEYFLKQNYDMFDVLVFSCAERTKKPERKIYEIVLERLGINPDQAVFIDNREDFIDGAQQVGINTILFESAEQVKNKLRQLGVTTD